MDRIRAITFDAFGTIVDTGRDALIGVASRVVQDHGLAATPAGFLERWDHYFFGIDHDPFLTLAEATRVSLTRAFDEIGVQAAPGPYVEMLQREWMRAKAYAEVAGVLEALDGIPRAVVSNADDAMLKEILDRNGLEFDAVVTSEACRAYKPASAIFEVAMRELRVGPAEVLHVGDSLEADVGGAQRLGIATAWVNRTGEAITPQHPKPDLVMRNLAELPPAFGR
jgi:2-haloacid dehalogenase/putative hydrolase of the HAD superfamily